MFRASNPVGAESFCTRPDWSWGPPSLLKMSTWSFPGTKLPGRGFNRIIPSTAEVKESVELCPYTPSWQVVGGTSPFTWISTLASWHITVILCALNFADPVKSLMLCSSTSSNVPCKFVSLTSSVTKVRLSSRISAAYVTRSLVNPTGATDYLTTGTCFLMLKTD
jgi:hypothetical protein